MSKLHVLAIPYPAQGHVIPLMELSQCLIQHGFKVTFVNTKYNHGLIAAAMSENDDMNDNQVHLVSIPDGLDSPEDRNQPGKLSEVVLRFLPGKVEELIEEINDKDDDKIGLVLADQSLGWALEIAEKKRIRKAAFCPAAAALLVLTMSIPKLIEDGIISNDGTPVGGSKFKLSPDMPQMNEENLVWTCLGNKTMQKHIFELISANIKSLELTDWILCNSSYELEPGAFTLAPKIQPIGPLVANHGTRDSQGSFWPIDPSSLNWLDQQKPSSVIFIAFGSLAILDTKQFQELALGIELANRPFLWVVRPENGQPSRNHYPVGFLERVKHRGMIVDWAPQQMVLKHPSVACFLGHCGWNSTMEGMSNGVPFLCWPCFADQFLNKSYICDIWQVGVELRKNESGVVASEEIKDKLEELMEDEGFKARALRLQTKVLDGAKEGGGSCRNFKKFIEWMKG